MADPPIKVDYNHELKPLEDALAGVERPGDFYVAGRLELPMPTVKVDGVGILSFPVPPFQVEQLIEHATRAPYGRGTRTVVDTGVRQVWQVAASHASVGGKSWRRSFTTILSTVARGLGCEGANVAAELYKLLIYDPGGRFKPHRDTEKSAGMFGTLVVVLPSEHTGGELVIRHGARETTVALSGADFAELGFAAFYADCEHELRPVTAGHRICLVYNLVQRPRGTKRTPLVAPLYASEVSRVAAILQRTLASRKAPLKIVWLLEHQYSPAGLSFTALKNADAARATVLAEAASRAGCAIHLGIVHIEEYGSAEPAYDFYADRRYGGWYGEDKGEDDGPEDEQRDEFDVVEVDDGTQFVDEWIDRENRRVGFGPIPLTAAELVPAGALDGEQPDQQRLMEATGNEGASFERAYHRAAVVIWHRRRYADVLLQAGVGSAMPYLSQQVAVCEAAPENAGTRRDTVALVRRMLRAWQVTRETSEWALLDGRTPDPNRAAMLDLLARLGDAESIDRFLGSIVATTYDGSENAGLMAVAPLLTPARARDRLSEIVTANMRTAHAACIDLLAGLARVLHTGRMAPATRWTAALRKVATVLVAALEDVGTASRPPRGMSWPNTFPHRPDEDREEDWALHDEALAHAPADSDRVAAIADLMDTLGTLAPGLRTQAAATLAGNPTTFDPVRVVVPALALLSGRHGAQAADNPGFLDLWRAAAVFLLDRSARPPERPQTWDLDVTFRCACDDCRELEAFARDPVEQTHRFPVRKDRRRHLHQTIGGHDLDMTHVTQRKGSPYTLVCTKTRRGFERRQQQYRADLTAMAVLLRLPRRKGASVAKRLVAAVERGDR
ncbi:MAG: 2OG-Fe(II) oxygenase [Vicinamibacterales bacterium]